MSRRTTLIIVLISFTLVIPLTIYIFFPKPQLPEHTIEAPVLAKEVWKPFTSSMKRFVVELPNTPHHAHETRNISGSHGRISYDMYVAQSRLGTTFMINVIEYPTQFDPSSSESILNGVFNDIVAGNDSSQVVHNELGTFLDCPSIDFVLSHPRGNLKVRAFLHERLLFVLSVADKDVNALDSLFSQFVDSFQILGSTQK